MGASRKHVNELCNDGRSVTAATALILARVFGNSPDFWLNVERRTDLWRVMNSLRERAVSRPCDASGVAESASEHYSRQYHYRVNIMEEAISAADANRQFSLLLRGVREGRSYVVTSHGKPVARIVPAGKHEDVAAGARTALLSRLKKQPVVEARRWTREELYEDDR